MNSTSVIRVIPGEGSRARVEYYLPGPDGRPVLDSSCEAFVGRNGFGKTREGDGKTPVGEFGAVTAFGIMPDPGTALPYTRVRETTFACDEDCPWYNRIIDTKETGHACCGERMADLVPEYNYGIALDYNPRNVYPLGSAIFFHCKGVRPWTAGCVAVDDAFIVRILKTCGRSPRFVIG